MRQWIKRASNLAQYGYLTLVTAWQSRMLPLDHAALLSWEGQTLKREVLVLYHYLNVDGSADICANIKGE